MLARMRVSPNLLIYLASASPRRSQLLTQIGIDHRIAPACVDESVRAGETPVDYVQRLAQTKAEALWQQLQDPQASILGADTSVVVDGRILGKPADEADGLAMLQLLAGRTHEVYTAVCLRDSSGSRARLSRSEVSFRELSAREIQDYWRTGEPVDKAGGYAVQGRAAAFISHIAGSYSGIMGLPLFETAELLATVVAGDSQLEAQG